MLIRTILFMLLTVGFAAPVFSATVPEFGASIQVREAEQPLSIAGLRGKLIVALFFKSLSQQGNDWAPDLIQALERHNAKHAGIIFIAVKVDQGTPEDATAFLKEYGANTDQWLIVCDTNGVYQKQLQATHGVWSFAFISPSGELIEKGDASTFYVGTDPKEFALEEKIIALQQLFSDNITMLVPNSGSDPLLKRASFLAETGRLINAIILLKEHQDVGGATALEQQMMPLFDAKLAAVLQTAENEAAPNRFQAYMELRDMVAAAKDFPQVKAARTAVLQLKRENAFRDELKAEEKWLIFQKQLQKLPEEKRQEVMLKEIPGFVKKYPDTYFGNMAKALLVPNGVGQE